MSKIGAKEIIFGTALTALLVGGTTAFLKTKQGKKFKRNLKDKYSDVRERIEDFVEDITENVPRTSHISGKAKQAVQNVMEEVETLVNNEPSGLKTGFIVGSVLGGLVGAGGALLLTSNHSAHNGSVLKNIYNQATNWKDFLGDVLEGVDEGADSFKNGIKSQKSRINNVLDLALAGVQIWQNARKRRYYAHH